MQRAEDLTRTVEDTTRRKLTITASLHVDESAVLWPMDDPDEGQEKVPGSPNLPGTGWNLTVAA